MTFSTTAISPGKLQWVFQPPLKSNGSKRATVWAGASPKKSSVNAPPDSSVMVRLYPA